MHHGFVLNSKVSCSTNANRFWISPPGLITAFSRIRSDPPGAVNAVRRVSNPRRKSSMEKTLRIRPVMVLSHNPAECNPDPAQADVIRVTVHHHQPHQSGTAAAYATTDAPDAAASPHWRVAAPSARSWLHHERGFPPR